MVMGSWPSNGVSVGYRVREVRIIGMDPKACQHTPARIRERPSVRNRGAHRPDLGQDTLPELPTDPPVIKATQERTTYNPPSATRSPPQYAVEFQPEKATRSHPSEGRSEAPPPNAGHFGSEGVGRNQPSQPGIADQAGGTSVPDLGASSPIRTRGVGGRTERET